MARVEGIGIGSAPNLRWTADGRTALIELKVSRELVDVMQRAPIPCQAVELKRGDDDDLVLVIHS